jgi:NADH-quinone oxidoreductase subunit G
VAVQSSADRLTRLLGIDSDPVNQGWLCDKGRFVFESVSAGTRLDEPMVRKDGELVAVGWNEALAAAARGIASARAVGGPGAVAMLGGARSTNEGAYAWARLAKGVLGTDSVDAQLGDGLPAELVLSLPRATIDQACAAPVVVLLGGDVREELPVLFLRLRRAALDGPGALVELTPKTTALTPYAAASLLVRPGDAPLVARALTGDDGAAATLRSHPEGAAADDGALARARELLAASGPAGPDGSGVVVVLGRPSMAEHEGVVAEAARLIAAALPGARFLPALRRGNVHGALDMGLAPGILPGRVALEAGREWFTDAWGSVPAERGLDATGILTSLADGDGGVRALVVVGADPTTDFADGALAVRALDAADFVVAVTGHRSATAERADVVLPAAVAHERGGTTTSIESRVSRLAQKVVPPGQAWPDWMIAAELADALGGDLGFTGVEELWEEVVRLAPAYAGLTTEVIDATAGRDGVVVPLGPSGAAGHRPDPIDPIALPGVESVERQGAPPRVGLAQLPSLPDGGAPDDPPSAPPPLLGAGTPVPGDAPHVEPVDSYSLRLVSTRRLYDAGSMLEASPSLRPLVDTAVVRANPYDLDRLGIGTGDPVRIRSSRGSLVLPAEASTCIPRGVAAVDFGLPVPADGTAGSPPVPNAAATLIDPAAAVTDVRLESVG